jgi:AAA+ ATPase superfamily predicted ATPase
MTRRDGRSVAKNAALLPKNVFVYMLHPGHTVYDAVCWVCSMFIGRARELAALEQRYDAKGGQLVLLAGRRRIGKTFLLQRFVNRHPGRAIFYQATRQAESRELAAFTELVAREIGGLPPQYAFPSWETALEFVTEHAGDERIVVILDEYPYLTESTRGLSSILQRWWDRSAQSSRVLLVLCGSEQAVMDDLDSGAAPLHQRFTLKLRLEALAYDEAAELLPRLDAVDCIRVYAILGGTPLYVREWDTDATLRANVLRLFGDPRSALIDAVRLALHTDLGDATAAYRALSAVAAGQTKRNQILQRAQITNERTLSRLEDLGLLAKRVPITEGAASRRGLFTVVDPYFRFWFRFIEPHLAAIDRGFGKQLVDETILPQLDGHIGHVFEEIARTFVARLVHAGELEATDVGSWWSTDGQHEIDIVGMRSRPTFVGSVKWRPAPLGRDVYTNLADHARALGVDDSIPWILVGRGGVERSLMKAVPNLRGFSARDLYRR